MSDGDLRLYISGGLHVTRPKKRISEVEDELGDVDVLFVESPRAESPSNSTKLSNLLAAPILLAIIYLWVGLLLAWGRVTGYSDLGVVEYFGEEHGAKIVRTDYNVHRLIADGRRELFIGHALFLLIGILAQPIWVKIVFSWTTPVIATTSLFLAIGLAILAIFLGASTSARELKIAMDIEEYAAANESKSGCLIVGGRHAGKIRRHLSDSSLVTVISE